MAAGYSGTPLARKLSLKHGHRLWCEAMPPAVWREIEAAGLALRRLEAAEPPIDVAHLFVTDRAQLESAIGRLRPLLARDGMLWVSWPKRASGEPSDVSEDVVREIALPAGLVDVKVCAIDATWAGLKLVVRKALR